MQELLKLEEAAHVYLEDASEENEKKMMNYFRQSFMIMKLLFMVNHLKMDRLIQDICR